MYLSIFTGIVGLLISLTSGYYSIVGLTSIFSGAFYPIVFMGIVLEMGKITCTIWLHKHWNDNIGILKYYMSAAILILLIITSLGIYGFLTKSNLKQSESVDLNTAKVASLESSITREQSRLDFNTKQIEQYNIQLSRLITQDVRRASNERKRIQYEIFSLSKESKEINKTIDKLNIELTPYKSKINAVEVEVGTLVYISKLIYGDDYRQYLSKILTILTLLIIFVFDPLAIGLLIASQKSFKLISEKNELITDKNNDIMLNQNNTKNNSWDNFKMSGGSAKDIRERVENIKEQVKRDKQLMGYTKQPEETPIDDEWVWDENPNHTETSEKENTEELYYKSDNISDEEWGDESAEITQQQWDNIDTTKQDEEFFGRTPKRYRQSNKGNM